jgi:hypothetical protein
LKKNKAAVGSYGEVVVVELAALFLRSEFQNVSEIARFSAQPIAKMDPDHQHEVQFPEHAVSCFLQLYLSSLRSIEQN